MSTRTAPADPYRRARETAVLDRAEAFAIGCAAAGRQRKLLGIVLARLREQVASAAAPVPYIHLAPLVYCGLWGDEEEAQPLAAATTLVFAGLDLVDELAGRDLPACWTGYRPAEIMLIAATLLCSLPQLVIGALDTPPPVLAAMHQTLAGGLLAITANHESGPELVGATLLRPETVEVSVAGKSGAEWALFATLGAQLAGASPRVTAACAQLGRALGAGSQLAADCHDLFFAAWSRNMANGDQSLAISLHLAQLQDQERGPFVSLLDKARTDATAQSLVRTRLLAAGELQHCALMVETYCRRAQHMLAEAGLLEPARSQLQKMIAGISINDITVQ